jgi:hypothetical protein
MIRISRRLANPTLRALHALKPLVEADNRDVLDPAVELSFVVPVYMLLAGLAVETLAKARIVASHTAPTDAGILAQDVKKHDLIEMLRELRSR